VVKRGTGCGRATGAGTIINAIATYKGAAFGIDLWTYAEVELGADLHGVAGEIEVGGVRAEHADTRLIERCVELVLKRFELPVGAHVTTRSEIPIASGLKSSSAAANAAVAAALDALGLGSTETRAQIGALEAIRIGVDAALEVGVSITGAFDDACASALGGIVVTDNVRRELLKRVERESTVLIFVPRAKAFTANANVERSRLLAPWVTHAYDLALAERFEEAMTLNGFLYCAALRFDPEPMLRALACGVRGVSLSGTGPSVVALLGDDREKEACLYESWRELPIEGRILKQRLQNKPSLSF
jgi:shikimate kinase